MTNRVVLVVVALLAGGILGMESLGRVVGGLPRVTGWQAVIVILIILVGTWSLDRLLHALVHLAEAAATKQSKTGPTSEKRNGNH